MSNLAVKIEPVVEPVESVEYSNIISFDLVKSIREQEKAKSKPPNNAVAGQSSEVYAFKTKEEIAAMIKVFDKHIEEATNANQRQIARRNKMLFVVGLNVGVRASDLRTMRFSFFFSKRLNGELEWKDSYSIQPKKTRKYKKFVKLYFNQAVRKVVDDYVAEYPINDVNDYVFPSRKGDEPITVGGIRRILKDTAKEAGVNQTVGSHSLRKSFGFWVWHNAEDKEKALVVLSQIYNHSTVATTRKYIGLLDDEIEDTFNSLDLGLDMI